KSTIDGWISVREQTHHPQQNYHRKQRRTIKNKALFLQLTLDNQESVLEEDCYLLRKLMR
ncbi:MAG: hypothetical protein AB8A71_08075, partial [Prochlorococcus sp.]